MGGTNVASNLVELTPEEHYVAHQLLTKLHPNELSLVRSEILMSRHGNGNKAYGWLRRRFSELRRGKPLNLSAEARERLRERMRGNTFSLGHQHSLTAIAKIRAAMSGKSKSPEHVKHMSEVRKGHPVSEETRRKISQSKSGRKRSLSEEQRKKIGDRFRGKPLSKEHVEKMAAAQRGRTFSLEHRMRMSIAAKSRKQQPIRTPEWKSNIAAGLRGKKRKPFSDEWRRNMSLGQQRRIAQMRTQNGD